MMLEILHCQLPQQRIIGYNDNSAEGGNPCSEVSILNEVESIPKEVGADFYRIKKKTLGASLVAQWLRICLPMQGTRVRALVWEDPTCRGATRPVSHNY